MSYNAVSLSNGDGSVKQFGGAGGGGGSTTASNVSYNNTESQLAATNVQSAIDELAAEEGAVAELTVTTTSTELYGQTVTVAGQYETYTGTFSQAGQAKFNLLYLGEYTITCLDASTTVTITVIGDSYQATLIASKTVLAITANSSQMYGKTLTVSFGGSEIGTVVLDATGTGSFNVKEIGTYTLSYNGSMNQTVEVTELDVTVNVTYYGLTTLQTFAAATEQQVADMVKAADAGCLDLYGDCGWRVGQSRTVSLSAIASSGTYGGVSWNVGESQSAQSVTFVLMHRGLYQLVNPVKSKTGAARTTCSFVCGLKDCLATTGYMNSSDTNTGSWSSSRRRQWCNGGFRRAMPEPLRSCFKQFKTISAQAYNSTTNQTTDDYFALPAAAEVWKGDPAYGPGGSAGTETAFSNLTEFNALSRFTYYETTSNRVKTVNGSAMHWWERSPAYFSEQFCCVHLDNVASNIYASSYCGIAPFGCL